MRFALTLSWPNAFTFGAVLACAACSSTKHNGSTSGPNGDAGAGGTPTTPNSDAGAGGDHAAAGSGQVTLPAQLWYGGGVLCGFKGAQLTSSGTAEPAVALPLPPLTAVLDLAFDASGSAWVVGSGS